MDEQKQIWLKEYEICSQNAQAKEDVIWKTFSVIGVISITSLALVATSSDVSADMVASIGLAVISAGLIWWKMAQRWWDIQHLHYDRMTDIERELGMYMNRYIGSKESARSLIDDPQVPADRRPKLLFEIRRAKSGVQKRLILFVPLMAIIWFAVAYLKAESSRSGFQSPLGVIPFLLLMMEGVWSIVTMIGWRLKWRKGYRIAKLAEQKRRERNGEQ